MTAKIEPYCQTCGEFIPEPNVAYGISPDALCRCCKHDRIAAHAPKETGIKPDTAQAARQEPSVPVSKLKEFERELQWGSSIKRLRRLFTDIIHEAEQEKQP